MIPLIAVPVATNASEDQALPTAAQELARIATPTLTTVVLVDKSAPQVSVARDNAAILAKSVAPPVARKERARNTNCTILRPFLCLSSAHQTRSHYLPE